MSTRFYGEGNIGSQPELRTFPGNGNEAPRALLRVNVRFDNLVPTDAGMVDRGGFWANVEIWHRDAGAWANLYQQGMRVMVSGRMVQDTWKDRDTGEDRSAFKVQADRVGILPYRVSQVVLEPAQGQATRQPSSPTTQQGAYAKAAGPDGEWANPADSDPGPGE
ncbi:single-stranded DNA-binding protein [Salinicola peritrichatus]|uniref:single-stranded DNA-binding protein n=1 Tax=Salinicola peritrichatus TaxID=1267424 RepID=UPI000DA1D1B0|nr:single-stranded DNA-binding protein [Salinicola peritrichatus]